MIGVLRGGVRESYLLQKNFKNLESVSSHKQNIIKLKYGRIPVILYSPMGLATMCAAIEGIEYTDFEMLYQPNYSESYIVISTSGTDEKLVRDWKNAAKKLLKDGTFVKIAKKWQKRIFKEYGFKPVLEGNILNL